MLILLPTMAALVPPPPALSLRLFGPFVVTVHGTLMPKIRSQKEQWLLALLALHAPAPLERSWLAATLWPETTDEAALYNLRRTLRFLRDALGPEADRLCAPTPRTLRLDLAEADCDVAAFDAALRRGDRASLAEAAALYAGPLLLGCPEEWAFPEREARERAVVSALEALAAGGSERGDRAGAATFLRRALEIDPLRETALRALLQTLAAQGCHPEATDAYRAFRRRVRDELNAEPDPETIALYRRLQAESRRQVSPTPSAPVSSRSQPTTHLPTPLTNLIGRTEEIAAVTQSLDRSRLVTLTGPGGVGKTRLALAVARSLHEEFGDGAWFADIALLGDAKLLTVALVTTLGLREAPGRTPNETLVEFLRPKKLLLVLDNCEHLADACAHLTLGLLRECPSLHILATSREPLRVPGEAARPVPGLPPSEAARLFTERAAQASPVFRLTPAGEEVVADICRRLDGIPLAIEMAAARTRALPLPHIAARLGDAFRLLTEPGGDLLPRHQTLRATLDWSYDLLSAAEKTLLARLSVFAGGWTLEAAETVCADPVEARDGDGLAPDDVLDLLAGLVDKSLVVYEEQPDGTARYRLLETVRQYACDRLAESVEADGVQKRAASWFLALAEEAEPQLTGPEQASWLSRLEIEHDNLRASLSWYEQSSEREREARTERADEGLRLAGALSRFWDVRCFFTEGRQWLQIVLEKAAEPDGASNREASAARARALTGAANLSYRQGDYGDARTLYEKVLTLQRLLGNQRAVAITLYNLGLVTCGQGDYVGAQALQEEGLSMHRQLGNQRGIANSLSNLGTLAYYQGDYAGAQALYEESLTLRQQLGDQQGIATSLGNLALVGYEQGDYGSSRTLNKESMTIQRQLGDQRGIAHSLEGIAAVAHRQNQLPLAVHLWGAASSLRELIVSPLHNVDQVKLDAIIASARATLGEEAFAAAWAEGQAMTWEQAVDFALSAEV